MSIAEMSMAEVEARLAEIPAEIEKRSGEELDALKNEVVELQARRAELADFENRKAVADALTRGAVVPAKVVETRQEVKNMNTIEERAQALVDTGKTVMETRQLLAAGTLTPGAVKPGIAELPSVVSSIVDDINAVIVDGIGSYSFAYQKTGAAAVTVQDGKAIGGTGATFDKGSISPETWGILDSISRLVSKKTPLDYMSAIERAAYLALRRYAKAKIVNTVLADSLADAKTYALDHGFVRSLVLGFNADESVMAGTKLYLCKEDLATLGAVRGTNEKKPIFEITFSDENNGQIKDGGMVVNFSICSDLKGKGAEGTNAMIYGQPKAITMPLWGNYEISTDEGGKYFDANLTGIRGLQTAGVGITAPAAIQIING